MSTMRLEVMTEGKDVNETWGIFKKVMNEMIEKHVPMRTRKKGSKPKWLDRDLSKLIEKKKKAWNRYKKTKTDENKAAYKSLEKQTKKAVKNKKNALERKVAKEVKGNPKSFYAYVNSSKRNRSKIGPLKSDEGELVVDPEEQATILNDFYASVFSRNEEEPPEKVGIAGEKELKEIVFTRERVIKMIEGLKERSTPGPDQIPNKLLKEVKNEIADLLTILYNKCMDASQIPDDWRESHITPIFKKGQRTDLANYRPVNLTSGVCKGMEILVKEDTDVFLESNNLIKNSQHGFRRRRSPQTNMIEFLEMVTKWHDAGKPVDVVYFDFSKAFDTVCHKRLLIKLEAIGIKGKLKALIKDWLSGRRQRVVVNGKLSDWKAILSSVLQGSVLGGMLFNIYIDDLDDVIRAFIRKFADDTKIARIIETEEDAELLQKDIDAMVEWAKNWAMKFNVAKCKVLHVGRNNREYEYKMNGVRIEEVTKEKDLGIWVSDDLKPSEQCEAAAKKANSALGMVLRAFHYRKQSILVHLYKCFVRPKMEFAVAAWSPWFEKDIEVMEKVQKRAIRAMTDVHGDSYEERLKKTGLTTLKERRVRGDLIETFKVLKGFDNVIRDEWFDLRSGEETRPTRANTRIEDGIQKKKTDVIYKPKTKSEVRLNFFTVRIVRTWNELPDEVKEAKSVTAFKILYDRHVKERDDE